MFLIRRACLSVCVGCKHLLGMALFLPPCAFNCHLLSSAVEVSEAPALIKWLWSAAPHICSQRGEEKGRKHADSFTVCMILTGRKQMTPYFAQSLWLFSKSKYSMKYHSIDMISITSNNSVNNQNIKKTLPSKTSVCLFFWRGKTRRCIDEIHGLKSIYWLWVVTWRYLMIMINFNTESIPNLSCLTVTLLLSPHEI